MDQPHPLEKKKTTHEFCPYPHGHYDVPELLGILESFPRLLGSTLTILINLGTTNPEVFSIRHD